MGVGDDVAVLGQDHSGAGGGGTGLVADNGHHGYDIAHIDILQGHTPLLRHIADGSRRLLQIHGHKSFRDGQRLLRKGGRRGGLGNGGFRGVGNGQFIFLPELQLTEQPDIQDAQHGDDAAQENDQDQHQSHKPAPALGRLGRAGTVDAVVPVGVMFAFIHKKTSVFGMDS